MPRANPENRDETYRHSRTVKSSAGSQPVVTIMGPYSNNIWTRTYTSSNTTGFPFVKPLPFRNHEVVLRTRPYYGPMYWYKGNLSGSTYTIYNGIHSPQLGVGQLGVDQHAPSSALFSGDADIRARSKVISEIQRMHVNVAQNVAEYRQVQNMFLTNVRRITNFYRAVKHGDVRGMRRQIPLRERHAQSLLKRGPMDIRRNAPTVWLECQYGWRPLLGDVYTGVTNFYKRVEEGYTIRARGRGSDVVVINGKLNPSVGIVDMDDTSVFQTKVMYIIDYEIDFARLANMSSWGLTNPALLAWELVPYSFVVDWFLPVGDWLSQVGYSAGLYFKRGMRSGVLSNTTIRRFKPVPSTTEKRIVSGEDMFKSVRFKREVLGTFPSPGRPRLDRNGLRGLRIFNALSLLALAFDRKPPRKR